MSDSELDTTPSSSKPEVTKAKKSKSSKKTSIVYFSHEDEIKHKKLLKEKPFDVTRYGVRDEKNKLQPELAKLEEDNKAYEKSAELLKAGGLRPDGWTVVDKSDQSDAAKKRRLKLRTWTSFLGTTKFEHGGDIREFLKTYDGIHGEDWYQFDDAQGRPHWVLRASEFHEDSELRKNIPAELAKNDLGKIWVEKDANWLQKVGYFIALMDGLTYTELIEMTPRLVPTSVHVKRAIASINKGASRKRREASKDGTPAKEEDSLDEPAAPDAAAASEEPSGKKSKKTHAPSAVVVPAVDGKEPAPELVHMAGITNDVLADFDASTLNGNLQKAKEYEEGMDSLIEVYKKSAATFARMSADSSKERPKNGLDFIYERFFGLIPSDAPNREALEKAQAERRTKLENALKGGVLENIKKDDARFKTLMDLMAHDGSWSKTRGDEKADGTTLGAIARATGGSDIIYVIFAMHKVMSSCMFGSAGDRDAQMAKTLAQAKEFIHNLHMSSLQVSKECQERVARAAFADGRIKILEEHVKKLEEQLKTTSSKKDTPAAVAPAPIDDLDMPDLAANGGPASPSTPSRKQPSAKKSSSKAASLPPPPPPPPPPAPTAEAGAGDDGLDI